MEINYGEVFGVEIGSEGNAGAGNTEKVETGVKEQAVAEPVAEKNDGAKGPDEQSAEGQAVINSASGEKSQTSAENSKYAAARRKAENERDAAIEEAKKKAQEDAEKYISEAFKKSGMTNPYTGKPITNQKEFEDYSKQFDVENKKRFIKKAGISDEEFDEFLNSLPEIRDAKERQLRAEEEAEKARAAAVKAKIDEEIKEIGKISPEIKSVDDLMSSPSYSKVLDFVKMGHSILDAYKFANLDSLIERSASSARQQTINSVNNKSHLEKTVTRGAGALPVPDAVKRQYRELMPGATDDEIAAHYNNYIKK